MDLPHAPRALPLICYEAIFPGDIVPRDDRPGWIVNVTNDGWFGISTGPYQHLQQTRMRAIEEGLPMVRAANTGISAVIDPVGHIVARFGLGLEGVLDSGLPSPLPPTVYARFGDMLVAVMVALAAIIVARRRTKIPSTADHFAIRRSWCCCISRQSAKLVCDVLSCLIKRSVID